MKAREREVRQAHLAVCRVESGGRNRLRDFLSHFGHGQRVGDWSATSRFAVGDLVLFYFGEPRQEIVAIGFVSSAPHSRRGPFDWTERESAFFCDFEPVVLLTPPVNLRALCERSGLNRWYRAKPYRSTRVLDDHATKVLLSGIARGNPSVAALLKGDATEHGKRRASARNLTDEGMREGGAREVELEVKSRAKHLRERAIAFHGSNCQVCGVDSQAVYGGDGERALEVHHLSPLSLARRKRDVSLADVRVVCANCHRVLHREGARPVKMETLRQELSRRGFKPGLK